MAVPCRRDRDGRARGAIAGRSAPIVMCDTIFAGDEVAHYGLVSPAHYGFWKAMTRRHALVTMALGGSRRGVTAGSLSRIGGVSRRINGQMRRSAPVSRRPLWVQT